MATNFTLLGILLTSEPNKCKLYVLKLLIAGISIISFTLYPAYISSVVIVGFLFNKSSLNLYYIALRTYFAFIVIAVITNSYIFIIDEVAMSKPIIKV